MAYNSKHKEYLVVWHNEWGGGYRDIYAQRVTATGELKSWFAVSAGANSRAQPSVAYDPQSDRYLVTWVYDVFGNGSDWDVWGRFIPWNGPDSSLTEFVIRNWGTTQWNPDVAYAAAQKEFLVVWTNINTSVSVPAYISGRRIFAGGGFPDTKGFTIASDTARPRLRPDITYNLARNEYLVAFDDDIDIFAARIAGNGALIAGGEFKVAAWPDAENRPAAAACAAADQYLVTWQSSTVNKHDIYGYLLSGAGAPQKVINIQGASLEETSPEVICDPTGQNYLVIWQQEYGLGASTVGWATRRIHPDGQMDGVWGYMGPGDLALPILAAGDVNLLAVWEQKRRKRRVSGYLRLLDPYGTAVCAGADQVGYAVTRQCRRLRLDSARTLGAQAARSVQWAGQRWRDNAKLPAHCDRISCNSVPCILRYAELPSNIMGIESIHTRVMSEHVAAMKGCMRPGRCG